MNSASMCKAKYAAYVKLTMSEIAFHGYLDRRCYCLYTAIFPQVSLISDLRIQK
jgi:hypothetical protein